MLDFSLSEEATLHDRLVQIPHIRRLRCAAGAVGRMARRRAPGSRRAVGRPTARSTQRCSTPSSGAASAPTAAADRSPSSGVKGRPKEAYFGAVGGGLWKTTDGGDDWAPVTDGQITSSSVGAVAVSESNPDVVYIGMGESCIRGNIMPGDGVYKSTDAGKTWTHVGFDELRRDLEDPHPSDQPRHRLRRRLRPLRRAERRARRLQDHRRRQDLAAKVLFRDNKTGAVDIAIDRKNPNVMYAAMWEAYRVEYQMSSGGPGSGLFKSTDGGETWTEITRNPGLPAGHRRQDRRRGVRRRLQPRLRARRERERRPLQLRRRRRDVEAGQRGPQHPPARVLLHARLRRSEQQGHRLRAEHERVPLDRRRQDARAASAAARTAIITISGSIPTTRSTSCSATTAAARSRYNVAARAARTGRAQDFPTAQFYHVITTGTCRITSAARSRTTARCACRATPGRAAAAAAAAAPAGAALSGRRRRARLHRARSEGPRRLLRRRATTDRSSRASIAAPASCAKSNPYPRFFSGETSARSSSAGSGPIRSSSRRSIRTCSTPRRSTCGRRPTAATLGQDQRRPHAPRSEDDAGLGRADHARHEQPGDLRHGVRARPGQEGRQRHLGRIGRRPRAASRATAARPGRTSRRRTCRTSAASARSTRRRSTPARAYVAVKKPLLGDFAPYIFRTHDFGKTWTKIVTGIPANDYVHVVREDPTRRGPALRRHAARLLRLVRRRRSLAAAVENGCPTRRCHDIWVEANASRSRRTAAASTSSTTSRRCGSTARRRRAADVVSVQAGRRDPRRRPARRSPTG